MKLQIRLARKLKDCGEYLDYAKCTSRTIESFASHLFPFKITYCRFF